MQSYVIEQMVPHGVFVNGPSPSVPPKPGIFTLRKISYNHGRPIGPPHNPRLKPHFDSSISPHMPHGGVKTPRQRRPS